MTCYTIICPGIVAAGPGGEPRATTPRSTMHRMIPRQHRNYRVPRSHHTTWQYNVRSPKPALLPMAYDAPHDLANGKYNIRPKPASLLCLWSYCLSSRCRQPSREPGICIHHLYHSVLYHVHDVQCIILFVRPRLLVAPPDMPHGMLPPHPTLTPALL